MAGICCSVVGDSEPASARVDSVTRTSLKPSLKRRLDLLPSIKIVAKSAVAPPKRQKREKTSPGSTVTNSNSAESRYFSSDDAPKIGTTSVCGRRRDMEDAVSLHPSLLLHKKSENLHFYGVFDGHGCSHVAEKCRERLHEIVKQEAMTNGDDWKETMVKSFKKMDSEVSRRDSNGANRSSSCRCELQSPQCDAVGSTAVVSVITPEKIVVSNCGDSRAVLCRNGVAIPLSSDHKPDRPDELNRIQEAGGRVIYWDGARVLGVLAMSRAIGDNYLKPYVIPDPEVTVTDRTDDDECLILASDGLWDVVTNETACGVARMCLKGAAAAAEGGGDCDTAHNACSDAALLLTKLALARQSSDNVSVVVVDLRKRSNY
ncbi:unnamed protein product [Eruca vesicaria subsp. sativa]|uniref:protein-serine/threonine phosphatase n=1 Tax=Eruca vesicaria subsp. sativa TaxID=29727 RepID=A0ABC8KPC5_ERUVS|nr:unnamed protein product [Eruca vesicaria subsp. sativa]